MREAEAPDVALYRLAVVLYEQRRVHVPAEVLALAGGSSGGGGAGEAASATNATATLPATTREGGDEPACWAASARSRAGVEAADELDEDATSRP